MSNPQTHNPPLDPGLRHQARPHPLTAEQAALAAALQSIFGEKIHAFDAVAEALQTRGIARPSGSPGDWTDATLIDELAAINAVLDASYARDGIGA